MVESDWSTLSSAYKRKAPSIDSRLCSIDLKILQRNPDTDLVVGINLAVSSDNVEAQAHTEGYNQGRFHRKFFITTLNVMFIENKRFFL